MDAEGSCCKHDRQQYPPVTQEIAGCDQAARQGRKFFADIFEYRDNARHYVGQHCPDDTERHQDQDGRVDHRDRQFLLQRLSFFRVIRKAVKHGIQVSGLFAGCHGGAKYFREDAREFAHAVGKRMAFHHAAAYCEKDISQSRFFGLLCNGEQRFFQR